MTVLSTTNKMAPQVMNGIAVQFSFTFRALVESAQGIKAIVTDTTTNTDTQLVLGGVGSIGYTVTINDSGIGGYITVNDPRSAIYTITIYREYEETQESNYEDYNSFPAETVEDDYDKGTMIDQQLTEALSRTLVLPITVTGVDTTLPYPEAGKPIGWNNTADGLTNDPSLLYQLKVDEDAIPQFMGTTAGDGVLRVNTTNLSKTDGGDFVILNTAQNINSSASPTFNGITLTSITLVNTANEISTDTTLGGDSDTAIPTEHAVKTYVDNQIGATNEFIELIDTPATYVGNANRVLVVNATPNAIVYQDVNYAWITSNDASTDVTASELEELTDGSTTTLHSHSGYLDPMTTRGDILYRNPSNATDRLGVGAVGTVLSSDGTDISWQVGGGGGSASTVTYDVNQATHGFSVGDVLRLNGTSYTEAQANTSANAEVVGIVSVVDDVNNFTLQVGGRITGLSGLTAGDGYFLRSDLAGAITSTEPTTIGNIVKPVLIADTTTSGFIFNMRGIEVGNTISGSIRGTFVDGDLTTGVLTITHNLGLSAPYPMSITIFDNTGLMIVPDDVTGSTNSHDVDLSSFGTLTGTWGYVYTI